MTRSKDRCAICARAAVIVWAQADPETPLSDGGLSLAVQEDFPALARLVLGILALCWALYTLVVVVLGAPR